MREFEVTIMETLFKIVTIEAETVEDAHTKVRERWHNSEYILDADDFAGVEFGVLPAENGD